MLSRRSALKGGTAAVAAIAAGGAVAARVAVANPDAELLSHICTARTLYEKNCEAYERWIAEKHRVEALPECPPSIAPAFDRSGYERFSQFMTEHGIDDLADRSNSLHEETGRAVEFAFQIPARSLRGALEKLKVAYLAIGDGPGTCTGDEDLNVFQDLKDPWMESIIRDLERLAGEVQS